MDNLGKPFILVGAVLVIGGVALLGYLGVVVFQIIDSPHQVPIVKLVIEHIRANEKMIYGHAGNDSFEFNLTEPARTVILLFFAVVLLAILAGIAKSIISAGINIIRFSGSHGQERLSTPQPKNVIERTK